MKLSVIVPIFNSEQYLSACVESILSQTMEEIEVILIDDGSTDSSLEICRKYAEEDPRVKVISKKNGGVSSARNTGLSIARGEYIGFVDSDDYIAPDMYQELYLALTKYDADIAICKRIIPNSKHEYGHQYPIETVFSLRDNQNDWKRMFYKGDIETFVTNKLFRRSMIIDNSIFFLNYPILEDKIFLQDIFLRNPNMIYLDKPFYTYRTVEGSSIRKYQEQRYQITQILHEKDMELCCKYDGNRFINLVYERMVGDIYNCVMQEKNRKFALQKEMFDKIAKSTEFQMLSERIPYLEVHAKKLRFSLSCIMDNISRWQ